MVTTAGIDGDVEGLVIGLIQLEFDTIAAYDGTIARLSDGSLRRQVARFREDHLRHLSFLRDLARDLAIEAPQEGDSKEWMATGKVAIAGVAGDAALLMAMKTNETDTIVAYQRASRHPDATETSRDFFAKALADEQRHRDWMEQNASFL